MCHAAPPSEDAACKGLRCCSCHSTMSVSSPQENSRHVVVTESQAQHIAVMEASSFPGIVCIRIQLQQHCETEMNRYKNLTSIRFHVLESHSSIPPFSRATATADWSGHTEMATTG